VSEPDGIEHVPDDDPGDEGVPEDQPGDDEPADVPE